MAVIYETEKDLRQKTLDDQAKSLHLKAAKQATIGMAEVGIGIAASSYNVQKAVPSRGGLAWLGTVIGLVGIIDSIKSFFTSRDAHKVERQLQLEGPQVSVVPHTASEFINFGHVAGKNFAQNIQPHAPIEPTTLLEHAQTVDCGGKAL